jgi:hypothetical protein
MFGRSRRPRGAVVNNTVSRITLAEIVDGIGAVVHEPKIGVYSARHVPPTCTMTAYVIPRHGREEVRRARQRTAVRAGVTDCLYRHRFTVVHIGACQTNKLMTGKRRTALGQSPERATPTKRSAPLCGTNVFAAVLYRTHRSPCPVRVRVRGDVRGPEAVRVPAPPACSLEHRHRAVRHRLRLCNPITWKPGWPLCGFLPYARPACQALSRHS